MFKWKTRIFGDKRLKLTPEMKAVYKRAAELVDEYWIQSELLAGVVTEDATYSELDPTYEKPSWQSEEDVYEAGSEIHDFRGWANGKVQVTGVCAVGAIERAAWEVLGKPFMGEKKNQRRVEGLATRCVERADAMVDATFSDDEDGRWITSVIDFNDDSDRNKEDVVEMMKAVGYLDR